MRQCYTFGGNVGAQGSQHRRNTGADVVAQQHGDGTFQRNQALVGNGNQNADSRTAGLNDHRHYQTYKHA